jgi:NitT/TauT family transport system substrate-binding protein
MGTVRWSVGALILVALLGAAACRQGTGELPVLRLGHALHDHHAPLYVAARNAAYFREQGGVYLREVVDRAEYELVAQGRAVARVRIGSSTGGQELVRRLAEDQFDVAFGGFPAMVEAIDRGAPLRIIAPVMAGGAALVVGPELPVESWGDFVGIARTGERPLRIGYTVAVSVQGLVFEEALRAEGLRYADQLDAADAQVVLLNLHGPGNLIPALENGLVDGFVAMQPYVAMAQEQGAGKLVTFLEEIPFESAGPYPCCAVAARSGVLQAQGRAVELLLELLLRATRHLAEDPEGAAPLVAQWLDGSAAVEGRSLPTIHFTTELDAAWNQGAEAWVRAMTSRGLLGGQVGQAYRRGELAAALYDLEVFRRARSRL